MQEKAVPSIMAVTDWYSRTVELATCPARRTCSAKRRAPPQACLLLSSDSAAKEQ